MRDAIDQKLSFNGYWTEEGDETLKTTIRYKLLSYGQLLEFRKKPATLKILLDRINKVEFFKFNKEFFVESNDKEVISGFIKSLETDIIDKIIESMILDSTLSSKEIRRLEYITFYLNWKADEHTRRKAYNCSNCHEWDFISSRLCYLDEETFELPVFEVDNVKNTVKQKGDAQLTHEEFLGQIDLLARKEQEMSSFDIGQKYYGRVFYDDKPGKEFELCPEAVKIKSEYLAELFEMENRASEYKILPFPGSQTDQPTLIIEAFDAIRTGRNLFLSKQMHDFRNKIKKK